MHEDAINTIKQYKQMLDYFMERVNIKSTEMIIISKSTVYFKMDFDGLVKKILTSPCLDIGCKPLKTNKSQIYPTK